MSWESKIADTLSKRPNLVYTKAAWIKIIQSITQIYIAGVSSGVIPQYISSSMNADNVIKYIALKGKLGKVTVKAAMDEIEIQSRGGFVPPEIIQGKKVSTLDKILNPISKTESAIVNPISKGIIIPIAIIAIIGMGFYLQSKKKG